MTTPLHVIIAGAGLAGPALAVSLAKNSIKSTILERRPYMQDIGGVIMLAPNAMRVMDEILEVGDRLRTSGDTFKAINIYTKGSGPTKLDKVGGFTVEDDGILGLSIARPVLHQELLRKCEEMSDLITIRYSSELESIKEDSEGCQAMLKGGAVVDGEHPGWFRWNGLMVGLLYRHNPYRRRWYPIESQKTSARPRGRHASVLWIHQYRLYHAAGRSLSPYRYGSTGFPLHSFRYFSHFCHGWCR
jgi:hypothetical protein